MRLTVHTLDEREAMALREQGWKVKSMQGSEWELVWLKSSWPPAPTAKHELEGTPQ